MISFDLAMPGRVLFGRGKAGESGKLAAEHGRRALVVTGRSTSRATPLLERLKAAGVIGACFPVAGEPTTTAVESGVERARELGCDLVIGFGGGSAIDAAKAIAALATNPGLILDYLEVIGRGRPITQPPLPCIAIPTTAGTGAEATRNAVLASREHKVKVSLRSPLMLPRVAVVDSELTQDLPPEITAATGLDALTQLIEAFVSCRANPFTDALCRDGMARAARSLSPAHAHAALPANGPARNEPRYLRAREEMALASLWSGMALAGAGLGAVHGFAGPIGGMFPAPHGATCAALLPEVMAANIEALEQRAKDHPALGRYGEVACLLTGIPDQTPAAGVEWVRRLCTQLGVMSLGHYGIRSGHVAALVERARQASSMKGNPVVLADKELARILENSL